MAINLKEMIILIANNDPLKVYEDLLNNDEEFKRFIEGNKDKNTEQMIIQYGLKDRVSHV